jgi:para-nitrobenzyl esterase
MPNSQAAAASEVVDAPAGQLRGTVEQGLRIYPRHSLRQASGRRAALAGARKAAALGRRARGDGVRPGCFQPKPQLSGIYTAAAPLPMSEDCLTLNVWAPEDARDARCSSGSTAAR